MIQPMRPNIPATLDECMDAGYALHQVAQMHCLPIQIPEGTPVAGARFGLEDLPVVPRQFMATSVLDMSGPFAADVLKPTVSSEYRSALDIGARAVLLCTDRPPQYIADPYPDDVTMLAAHELTTSPITEPLFLRPRYELRVTRTHIKVAHTSYTFEDGGITAHRRIDPSGRMLPDVEDRHTEIWQFEAAAITALGQALLGVTVEKMARYARRRLVIHQLPDREEP